MVEQKAGEKAIQKRWVKRPYQMLGIRQDCLKNGKGIGKLPSMPKRRERESMGGVATLVSFSRDQHIEYMTAASSLANPYERSPI